MKYSIVIPCYNESENLYNTMEILKKFPSKYDMEFILVENGSKDDSRAVFEKIDFDNKRYKKVYVDQNQGYGYGIQQGLKKATGDYVGWVHADLQVKIEELIPLIEFAEQHKNDNKNYMLKGRRKNRSILDHIFTGGMTIFETILFGKVLSDIAAIPVLFNKNLLNSLKDAPNDFSMELFTLYQAKLNKYSVIRFPVIIGKREKGKSSWNKGGIKSKIRQSIVIMKDSFKIRKGEKVK